MKTSSLCLVVFTLLCAALTAHAGAIARVPYRITKPGKYYLMKNLTPTATAVAPENAAIVIDASDVELDLQGFCVVANPANTTITTGILVLGGEGIRIRNGRIRGFATGLFGGSDAKDGLFEGLEIKSPTIPASSRTKGTHFRSCTFILDANTGKGLELTSSGGGPAHFVEHCTFYATSVGAAQTALSVGGGQPAIIRNCQFTGWALGIAGNNLTAIADNVFLNCTQKFDAGVSSQAGYNQ
jgi:hypothetical protein